MSTLTSVLTLTLIFTLIPTPAQAASCGELDQFTGNCPNVSGSVGDEDVTLTGSAGNGGTGSGAGSNGGGNTGTAAGNGSGAGNPQTPACGPNCREPFTVISIIDRPVTLSDIAHFRPNPGVNHMQPDGWMVVGLDTNFYSTGGVQVHNGTLLGYPASVRFTPIRWHWTYGDGTAATRATPGSTWAQGGYDEFDPTPTSHIYERSGTYYIDLSITYAVEYRFAGQAWTDIDGTLTLPANRLRATAGGAKTVLVEDDCTANSSGPGC